MGEQIAEPKYASLKLPTKFVHDFIDPYVGDGLTYSSRAHLVKQAVIKLIGAGGSEPNPSQE